MTTQRGSDFQRTIELVNKFTLSTVQFMNRFGATCETKLFEVGRTLERVEAQVVLLEYKLDSIDGDGVLPSSSSARNNEGVQEVVKPAALLAITGPPKNPPPIPGMGGPQPPQMVGFGGGASGHPPPIPGSKMPPLPAGFSAPLGGPLALMPPPPPPGGAPLAGFTPPPPPPMLFNAVTTRQHPKLNGYFRMHEAGVAVGNIKLKMQVDGHNPDWFDTPDAPAPASLNQKPQANSKSTMYDSD